MSGECDKCGEHTLQCKCKEEKTPQELIRLRKEKFIAKMQNKFESLSKLISEVEKRRVKIDKGLD